MTQLENIMNQFNSLTMQDKKQIQLMINSMMSNNEYNKEMFTTELREMRFNKGKVCPKCDSKQVVKNGKFNNKQRYLCKDCRKTATICGISLPTAFYWRHKVLDAIKKFVGQGDVEGIVEADETFFLESFKGNHKKSDFVMPRKTHKRGGQAKTSGISKEYVCVSTAIDRNDNIILEMTNMGRITINDLKRLYNGHIETGSIICTDSHRSYPKFANQLNLTHKKLKGGKKKEDIYHLQNVNSFHSRLKGWTRKFNGISTKHLSNYLGWFKYKELFKNEKEQIKMKNLLLHANLFYTETKIENISKRLPNFI